jgi:hypothetical protein
MLLEVLLLLLLLGALHMVVPQHSVSGEEIKG